MSDPVTNLAEVTMRAFARAAAQARPDSQFAQARERLGERYFDVAHGALLDGMKRVLIQEREKNIAALEGPIGDVAAQAILIDVVNDAIQAVIEEGTA